MNFSRYLFFIGLLLVSLSGFPTSYVPVSIGTKGELKDNYVHCIYKDSGGFIWVGTGTTVERWDGIESLTYSFPEYNLEYTPYLVNTMLERQPHDLWVGGKRGLWRLESKKRKPEHILPEQINSEVYALAKDLAGKLYIGTENGLYIYDDRALKHIRINAESVQANSNKVLGIETIDDDTVWLMTPEGIALCKPESNTLKFYSNTLAAECGELMSIVKVGQQFYIGTEKSGIIIFDAVSNTYSSYWNQIQASVSALSYEDGYLAAATLGQGIQLLFLPENRLVFSSMYDPKENGGLNSNSFSSILLSGGDIWCGTDYYSGMINLKKQETLFSVYSSEGFSSDGVPVRTMLLTDEQLFISNRDGFVCIREGEEPRYFNTRNVEKEYLRSDLIFSFYEYEGELLIGTHTGGVSAMNPDNYAFVQTPLTKALTRNDVFMFLEDKDNNLWVAASDGLYGYDKETQKITEYNAFNSGMPGNMVYGIFIDSQERFWVATNRGVALFDPETGRCSQDLLPEESLIRNEPVRSVYEGRDRSLYFCILNVNKEKTLCVADKELKEFRYPVGIECYNIIQDKNGFYWLGGYLGIIKANEEFTRFTLYTSANGLPDTPASSGAAIIEDKHHRLWMANMRGIVVIDPEAATTPSTMKITEVLVNGEGVQDASSILSGKLSLKKEENNLLFRFVSLGYENPEKMKYEYMLEGLDAFWLRLDHENKVSYYHLKPGGYTFKVRKLLDEESVAEISFRIERSKWPIVHILLLSAVVVCVLLFLRNKKKRAFNDCAEESELDVEEKREEASAGSYVKLTGEEAEQMIAKLKRYMDKEKPYLNVNLKQSEVAVALGYSTYLLSALFTHYLKVGYYDFVNTYRIEEFKQRVSAGEHQKYTLQTLAVQCGFKSKTSFFRFFKKATGLTPSEYIQQLK